MGLKKTLEDHEFQKESFVYNLTEDLLVLMERRELTHGDVAGLAGMKEQQVQRLLKGQNVGLRTIFRVISALDARMFFAIIPDAEAAQIIDSNTPKWQEQLEALNDCESHNDIYSIYPDRADGVYYWTCDGDIGSDSDYKRFNGSTPEAAIDAAYQSVIGSGGKS